MRVISGIARNHKLLAPEGMATRPITDQIKESLFDIWQFKVVDANFLDLFSGSGSVGIEALSRGAKKVIMVDMASAAVNVIKKNIINCQLQKTNYCIYKENVFDVIQRLDEKFDLIYLDPPFTVESIFDPVMEALGDGKLLAENGTIAIRSNSSKEMKDQYGCLSKVRAKKYGLSTIHFYKINNLQK